MRELLNEDMYLISIIADKANIKLPSATTTIVGEDGLTQVVKRDAEEYGLDLAMAILRSIHKAKAEINTLLKNVLEKDVDISKMTLKETKDSIIQIFKNEDFLAFFR
jgi:hypothetical protein